LEALGQDEDTVMPEAIEVLLFIDLDRGRDGDLDAEELRIEVY